MISMEKKSITGKDILRMDGLLPPTRRLPVCNAVTTPDKKKEKKWSIGGILKSISLIRDCDSSSNEEEMVYCKREPRSQTIFNRKGDSVTLRPVKKMSDQYSNKNNLTSTTEDNVSQTTDPLNFRRDSIHSRSSDGSLEGIGRKIRKNKLKARAEAKRDRICVDSSSDEDSRKSVNSLTRYQNEDHAQNNQKNSCNRKTRSARTERYIKRLSKDEGHGVTGSLSDISNKRNSLDCIDENQHTIAVDSNGLFRPPVHPRRYILQSNSHTFPVQRTMENIREPPVGLPDVHARSSIDITKYPVDQYITDFNQNNTYARPAVLLKKDRNCVSQQENNCFSNPLAGNVDYMNSRDYAKTYKVVNRSAYPPDPPPRDPRCRVFAYTSHSFPLNDKHQRRSKLNDVCYTDTNNVHGRMSCTSQNSPTYNSSNNAGCYGSIERYPRRPLSLNGATRHPCDLQECTNNKHYSTGKHTDESIFNETEAMKCQRRNNRNDQLNSNMKNNSVPAYRNKSPMTNKSNIYENCSSTSPTRFSETHFTSSPPGYTSHDYSLNTPDTAYNKDNTVNTSIQNNARRIIMEEDSIERKRNSKNLEEALSELEAIYNSLRLGDEDLLDRAERRSMEEFSLKHKSENIIALTPPDSLDRTKDDMAYRRMHPKERPTSLSDAVGQAALSNISYLMASPVLSRKDVTDSAASYPTRRDEPDVTRDDVVYRSIHHANNTLKVIDPQPPFGIPLGPVTSATESDYLHTKPSKPDQPRSPYIPQCEPDIVTDDLAYRALRKDANTTKHVAESKTDVIGAPGSTLGMKKKRAVRSLSANLYGLINQDRIHLRREPSLEQINDQFNETIDTKPSVERSDYFRRVVSDGELSDYDNRWHIEDSPKNSIDINGNHPASGLHRKKLRVYISPSTKLQSPNKESVTDAETRTSTLSDSTLSVKALGDEFWHDYVRPESNGSPNTNKNTESDFTAYSRLCQDLVNLIKGPSDEEVKQNESENVVDPIAKEPIKRGDVEETTKTDEPPVLRIQSLGSYYSNFNSRSQPTETTDSDDIERLTESIANSEKKDFKETDDNTLDFYLRLADENVKLIAEAFSSVADHLRDSRLSQKNSPTPGRSEIEHDSAFHDASTRSSIIYSEDDANDEQIVESVSSNIVESVSSNIIESVPSNIVEKSNIVPEEDTSTIIERDHTVAASCDFTTDPNVDAQLDLSRAVHDLQVAAASLREHEREIEELETLLKKNTNEGGDRSSNSITSTDDESLLSRKNTITPEIKAQKQEESSREETSVSSDIEVQEIKPDPESEGLQALARS